jgi:sugar O-acyltransferase (sialic acid O-acetyltransferase NeuD family)
MADLVIFGAGDIARLAHFYFTRDSDHRIVAFAVDRAYRCGESYLDLPLIDATDVEQLYPPSQCEMFIALSYAGMNKPRATKYADAKARGYRLASYVSSRCTNLTDTPVGDNCFILEDNTIQPFASIGNNVTLWSGNHIGHDAVIGDHCFITSHVVVAGHVVIGPYCFLGINSTIRNSITLAPETLVGAGAVVMKSTKPKSVLMPQRAELFAKSSDQVKL